MGDSHSYYLLSGDVDGLVLVGSCTHHVTAYAAANKGDEVPDEH